MSRLLARSRGACMAALYATLPTLLRAGCMAALYATPPTLLRAGCMAALYSALPTLVRAADAASAAAGAAGDADAGEDIRDIRGPKFILPWWFWYAIAAAVVLLGLAIYGMVRWRRSRRRERVLLHYELALKRLEEIRSLMQPQKAREFSTAASDIVRVYIEQRFAVTATHRTTEEFLHDLLDSSNTTLVKHRGLLSEFLQQCDLVKFAGMSLTTRNMESLHHSAEVFVQETAKPEEPPTPGQPPTSGQPPTPGQPPTHSQPHSPGHAAVAADPTQPIGAPAAKTAANAGAATKAAAAPKPKPKVPSSP